jgi:hypothetical protein
MMSLRIVLRSGRVQSNGLRPRFAAICVLAAVIVVAGCGGGPEVPVGNPAENIRKLALAYVRYAATNRGVGPSNQEALTTFLMQSNGLSQEEAKEYFVSPRDHQPYDVYWGRRPLGTGPIGHNPPQPSIIIVERTGAEGTRYVADGQVAVKEMSAAEFARAVPDVKTAGK